MLTVVFDCSYHRCAEAVFRLLKSFAEARQGFEPSDERFQNSRAKHPDRPFCKIYIDPKPAKLRREFVGIFKTSGDAT